MWQGPSRSLPSITLIFSLIEPSAAPEGFAVVALSSSSAYLTWNLPSLEDQNGDITGFTINVTDTETQQYDQFFTQSTNITILTLDPFTVYSFTIAALTSAGTGPYGGIVNIKTPEDGNITSCYLALYLQNFLILCTVSYICSS